MHEINREHPEYVSAKPVWATYRDLYTGGERLRQNASRYLERRQKEPADVYAERLSRVFYENYSGSIADWYAATLFRREPILTFEGDDVAAKKYFADFIDDCDLRGTNLTDFMRTMLTNALICGKSYALIDFPKSCYKPGNRAEEEELGAAKAYLVGYSAEELINWRRDERGSFEWIVLRSEYSEGSKVWSYYDRERFQIYRQFRDKDGKERVELTDEGPHGFASQGIVPLLELKISDGLWLMNKCGLLQLEHFNKSNALSWALTMGLFAQPVVYSDRQFNNIVGESYFIQLSPEDRFGWTEPEGKVFQIAADNLSRLKEEIYRVCYVLSQAGGAQSGGIPQSAMSKQRDFSITQEVLRAYGDAVKDFLKRALKTIIAARGDEVKANVSGLDEFDIGEFSSELADAQQLLTLGIPSETLRRQIYKKLALKYLCDVPQEVKERIVREIEDGTKQIKERT